MRRTDLVLIAGLSLALAGGLALLDAARPTTGPAPAAPATARVALPVAGEQASLAARPAPVPLHLKHRAAFGSVTVEALIAAATNDPAVERPADAPAEPLPETVDPEAVAARQAAEADGYRNVRVLRRGPDGSWRVSGLRGRTTVMLTVDAGGSVSAD